MPVRVARQGRKARDDHVRPELADEAHDVGHHLLPVPNSQRLEVILGKTEIHRARKILPPAVHAPRREQFLGADDAQFIAELRAEHVLAAVAARERKIGHAIIAAAREIGEHLVVFIVGMRGDVEHAAHFAKTAQLLQNGVRRRRLGDLAHSRKTDQAARGGNHELDETARERLGVRQPSGAVG